MHSGTPLKQSPTSREHLAVFMSIFFYWSNFSRYITRVTLNNCSLISIRNADIIQKENNETTIRSYNINIGRMNITHSSSRINGGKLKGITQIGILECGRWPYHGVAPFINEDFL